MSLDSQYETVNLKLDASIKFDKIYQRKTPLPNFIATFQSLATRCGKTEEQKVEALKRKFADDIAQQFPSDDFSGWVAKGSRFYENIQEYEHNLKTKGEGNRSYQNQFDKTSSSGKSTFTVSQGGDEMGLDQVTIFKLTEKEKNNCREHNLYFYCREQGHSIRECDRKWASDNKVSYRDYTGSHGTRGNRGGFQTPRPNLNHGHNDRFTWAQEAQGNWRGTTSQRTGFNRGGFNYRGHQGFEPSLRGGLFGPRNKPNQNGAGQPRAVELEYEWQEGEHALHHSYPKHEYSFPYTSGYNFDDVRHSENSNL
ncbi:hypothetical protein GcM1_234074 [Golovinomyces cichoracearum]|uniref:Uncharacterized protein n=1 Tax=Golovinomyces cichoracearum TaxID=62708 RepID=A0A420ILG0_9PEZI|nr:hypothetical protein GcM1_234074 [Golovinomyces cichoracearum]